MARKPSIHVGLATLTEGPTLLQFAGVIGEEIYTSSPTPVAFEAFREWLLTFRSTLVGVSSTRDFFLLKDHMISACGRWPFGDQFLDVNSWIAAKQGDPLLSKRWGKIFQRPGFAPSMDPVEVAKNRLWAITHGVERELPVARKKVAPLPKKSARSILETLGGGYSQAAQNSQIPRNQGVMTPPPLFTPDLPEEL